MLTFLMTEEGRQFLIQQYEVKERSTYDIAKELSTYPNCIRKALIFHRIKIRTKGEAQSAALKHGRGKHPTQGRERTLEEKNKISAALAQSWLELPADKYEDRVKKARDNWTKLSDIDKLNMSKLSSDGLRKAAKEGSELEKFLIVELGLLGYKCEFHRKLLISNESMHIDIWLPEMKTAIEIDGPSHYWPIWGEEKLKASMERDDKKNGLILMNGYSIVRVKALVNTVSGHFKTATLSKLVGFLNQIKEKRKPSLYYVEV